MSTDNNQFDDLRREALKRLEENTADALSEVEDTTALIHELQTHQIELEIQNEQLRATQADLEQARDEYSELFDFAPVGYLLLGDQGIIRRANLTMAAMLQVNRGDLQGKPLSAFLSRPAQNDYFFFVQQLPRTGQQQVEFEFLRTDGTAFTGQVSSVRHQSDADAYLIAVTDITEKVTAQHLLKEANSQLEERVAAQTEELRVALREAEQANELKVKFLGMISHELRTPLTSVLGFASTLLADDVEWDPDSSRHFIQTIQDEALKLSELVGQLLDLSRLEAGRLPIDPSRTTVAAVLEVAKAQLEMLTAEHELVVEIPDDLPEVVTDRGRVAQVLAILVDNASKYAPEGTRVTVKAQNSGHYVRVSVSDEGPGIPPAAREYVFEAFRRVDDNHVQGAGLGLAIARGIVEAHSGQIWLDEKVECGTTVAFTLPLAEEG